MERARAEAPYAPRTPEAAVKLERILFPVANPGAEQNCARRQMVSGPGGVNLAMSTANSATAAAQRPGHA